MRFTFCRFLGAVGVGTYCGAAVAGLVAVVLGQAPTSGSPWLTGLPVLAVLGGLAGLAIARLTRRWLSPRLTHRTGTFALLSAAAFPLAAAVGQMTSPVLPMLLMTAGAVITTRTWLHVLRASATSNAGSYRAAAV